MFGFFVSALNQMVAELPGHITIAATEFVNEGRSDHIDLSLEEFLRAVAAGEDAKALALCTPDLQKVLATQGVAKTFGAVRVCFVGMSGFEHAPPQTHALKTTCDLTGTIHYDGGKSRSYHLSLLRSSDELWKGWKVSEFRFDPISLAATAAEAAKAGS